MDPFRHLEKADLNFFKTVDVEVLCNTVTEGIGNSLLKEAVRLNRLDCFEEILKRCPELVYHRTKQGHTALHQAAFNGKVNFLLLLLGAISRAGLPDADDVCIEEKKEAILTAASGTKKETALHMAVRQNELECAKILIEADSRNKLLKMADCYGDTAMHIAVRQQNDAIVTLLIEAGPNSNYSANHSGHTPVLIAFEKALTGDHPAVEIRNLLIQKQPRECTIRTGAKNWNILHHAAYKGDLSTVEDIIRFSPDCLDLVDHEGQNFLHLAAKFQHVDLVKYTVGLTTLPAGVLNVQDNYGNTPLHVAALGGQPEMVFPLLYDSRVDKKIMNKQGKLALDMINFDYDKRRAGVYGLKIKMDEKEIKDQSDFDLVVCALIATVSFTAGITVPGGYIADGPNKGTAILAKKISFKVFIVANTIALLLSLYAVFSHFCARRLVRVEYLIYPLMVATYCSLGAIFAMVAAFISGSYAVLAVTDEFAIFVCVLCGCFFVFAFGALWGMARHNRTSRS